MRAALARCASSRRSVRRSNAPNRGFLARGTSDKGGGSRSQCPPSVGTAIARLCRRTVHQRSFQYLHGVLSGLQRRHGIDVEIHTEPMAQLIGNELGIDASSPGPARMRAAQDLKRVGGEFLKSRGDGRLIKSTAVLLPPVRSKA